MKSYEWRSRYYSFCFDDCVWVCEEVFSLYVCVSVYDVVVDSVLPACPGRTATFCCHLAPVRSNTISPI